MNLVCQFEYDLRVRVADVLDLAEVVANGFLRRIWMGDDSQRGRKVGDGAGVDDCSTNRTDICAGFDIT